MVLPKETAVATAVTIPLVADLWCVAFISTPTIRRVGPACN